MKGLGIMRIKTSNSKRIQRINLSELINFYFTWNHQETDGFLMILLGIEFKSYGNTVQKNQVFH